MINLQQEHGKPKLIPIIPTFTQMDSEIVDYITDAAQAWSVSPARPFVQDETLAHWDAVLAAWLDDPEMPLLVRNTKGLGTETVHASGKTIVCTDNAAANYCLALALLGRTPSLVDLKCALEAGDFPIEMIVSLEQSAGRRYPGCLARVKDPPNLNVLGWKVCHIRPVGLNSARDITAMPIESIKEACRRLVSPRNMFVVPKLYAGLGETPEFIAVFRGEPAVTEEQGSTVKMRGERSQDELMGAYDRQLCTDRVSQALGRNFKKRKTSTFATDDGHSRLVCAVSKEYSNAGKRYWFRFSPQHFQYLNVEAESYVAFGCGGPDCVLLIPSIDFAPLAQQMNETIRESHRYWHVHLDVVGASMFLLLKEGTRVDVMRFLITPAR